MYTNHLQELKSSHFREADLQKSLSSLTELRERLNTEGTRCHDLAVDLSRTKEELSSAQTDLARAEETKGSLQLQCRQLQVRQICLFVYLFIHSFIPVGWF